MRDAFQKLQERQRSSKSIFSLCGEEIGSMQETRGKQNLSQYRPASKRMHTTEQYNV